MRGLIAGVLGGAAKGYTQVAESEFKKQQELDLRTQLMEAETEKQLRIDEIKRNRDFTDKKRDIKELEPMRADAAANRTRVVGEAETGVLAEREDALRPGKIQTEKDSAIARGEAERENLGAYANDPKARAGVRAKTSDQESSSAKVSAAATSWELGQKRAVAELRAKLADLPLDSPEREAISQRIKDLSGTTTQPKSYADMVAAATNYRQMAQNLRKDADMAPSEAERADMLQRAMNYEREADAILQSTKEKRLGQSASKPAAAAPASGPAKPGTLDLNQFFKK